MTVTFSVAGLTKAATAALAQHNKITTDYLKACNDYRMNHAAERTAETRRRATALRDELTKALKKAGPVRVEQVPSIRRSSYVTDVFYQPPGDSTVKQNVARPAGLLTPAEAAETKALLAVLSAATGDTISANELKLLGLKNLAPVFIAAGAAG